MEVEKKCTNCEFYKTNRGAEYLTNCEIGCFLNCPANDFLRWKPKQPTGTTAEAKHYQVAEVQPIEVMQMYLTKEEMIGGLKWQVIKYILRIGHKGSDREDAGKCNQYAEWLCQVMDGKVIVPGGK